MISVLDMVERITDNMDAELIPINDIQKYIDNFGYDLGVNLSFYSEDDVVIREKMIRFMASNLISLYGIKTSRPSIRVLLYSFGVIGNLVHYYTRDYDAYMQLSYNSYYSCSNLVEQTQKISFYEVLSLIDESCLEKTSSGIVDIEKFLYAMAITGKTPDDIKGGVCVFDDPIFKSIYDSDGLGYRDIYRAICNSDNDISNGMSSYMDTIINDKNENWKLSDVNTDDVFDRIDSFQDSAEFFPTPHFRLAVSIKESGESFDDSKAVMDSLRDAIMAIKPINTVYDGVTYSYTNTDIVSMSLGVSVVSLTSNVVIR